MKPGQLVNLRWLNSKDSNIGLLIESTTKELVIIFIDPNDPDGYTYEPSLDPYERLRNIWYEINNSQDPIRITPCTKVRPFTNAQYLQWVELIWQNSLPIPIQVARRFKERIKSGNNRALAKGYMGNEQDYHSWGWALFNDITEDAELAARPFLEACHKFHL